jgi:hypothetical protein
MQLPGNYQTPNNEINKEEQGGQNRCLQAKKPEREKRNSPAKADSEWERAAASPI